MQMIHLQRFDRRSTRWRLAHNHRACKLEMFIPSLAARIKQAHDLICFRINSTQIWPLESIASATGERQIFRYSPTTMLYGNNVVYMEGQFQDGFRHPAILAQPARPPTDELSQLGCHG